MTPKQRIRHLLIENCSHALGTWVTPWSMQTPWHNACVRFMFASKTLVLRFISNCLKKASTSFYEQMACHWFHKRMVCQMKPNRNGEAMEPFMALWLHSIVRVLWSTHKSGDITSLAIGVPYDAKPGWRRQPRIQNFIYRKTCETCCVTANCTLESMLLLRAVPTCLRNDIYY